VQVSPSNPPLVLPPQLEPFIGSWVGQVGLLVLVVVPLPVVVWLKQPIPMHGVVVVLEVDVEQVGPSHGVVVVLEVMQSIPPVHGVVVVVLWQPLPSHTLLVVLWQNSPVQDGVLELVVLVQPGPVQGVFDVVEVVELSSVVLEPTVVDPEAVSLPLSVVECPEWRLELPVPLPDSGVVFELAPEGVVEPPLS
jgi:hypothetical protein